MSVAAPPYAALTEATVRTAHSTLGPWTLTAHSGECIALTGDNGAGKSTLLGALCGRIVLSSGTVTRHVPRSLAPEPFHPPAGLRTQAFFDHLCRSLGAPAPAAIATLCGPDVMNSRLDTLSRGQLKRVVIAQAFIGLPSLLLLDEPLEGVDTSGVSAVTQLVHAHVDAGGCAVIATHRPESWAYPHTRQFAVSVA